MLLGDIYLNSELFLLLRWMCIFGCWKACCRDSAGWSEVPRFFRLEMPMISPSVCCGGSPETTIGGDEADPELKKEVLLPLDRFGGR